MQKSRVLRECRAGVANQRCSRTLVIAQRRRHRSVRWRSDYRRGTAARAFAASKAQRAHFDRASEQLELTEGLPPGEQGVELGRLEILDPFAAHADDVMMRAGVAVVACGFVQRRDLAGLADVAQALERAMDGGERDAWMLAADAGVDAVGAWMVARFQQRAQHREALRRYCHLLAPAVGDEFRESGIGVFAASLTAKQFN